MKRLLLAATLLLASAGTGRADIDPCQNPFSDIPRTHPFVRTLRWDVGLAATALSDSWRFAGGVALGVAKIVDVAFQSFDVGLHLTVGTTTGDVSALLETIEADGRYYPVKLRQAFGIDQCGDGTKTRRWSETTNGVFYILARAGYGHVHGDIPSHNALLLSPGVGYEQNVGDGRHTALFAQAGWRFDVLGGGAAFPIGGPFIEAGLRF